MGENVKTTTGTLSGALAKQGLEGSQNGNGNTAPEKAATIVVSNNKDGQHQPRRGRNSKKGEKNRRNRGPNAQHTHNNNSTQKQGTAKVVSNNNRAQKRKTWKEDTNCPLCGNSCFHSLLCCDCNSRYKKEAQAAPHKIAQAIMDGKEAKEFPRKLVWTLERIDITRFDKEAIAAKVYFDLLRKEASSLFQEKREQNKEPLRRDVFNELRKMCFNKVGANKAEIYMEKVQARLKEAKRLLSNNPGKGAENAPKPEAPAESVEGAPEAQKVKEVTETPKAEDDGKTDKKDKKDKKPKEVKTTKPKAIKKPTAKKAASSKGKSEAKSSKAKKDTNKKK